MREIIFRGKHICNGEWYEGSLLVWPNGNCMIKQFGEFPFENKNVEVQPETAGQFTGLTDTNGKRIFEGDIVEVNHDSLHGVRGTVFFNKGIFMVKNVSDVLSLYGLLPWCEVIGNIHDYPELLGGAE